MLEKFPLLYICILHNDATKLSDARIDVKNCQKINTRPLHAKVQKDAPKFYFGCVY